MVERYDVDAGPTPTALCAATLNMLKLAMATVMAKAVARAVNNLQLLQLFSEFANATLDMALAQP